MGLVPGPRRWPRTGVRTAAAGIVVAMMTATGGLAAAAPATPATHSAAARTTAVPAAPRPAATGWRSPVYLMPLDNTPPAPSAMAKNITSTGEHDFMLSFVLDSGGCTPAWDGNASQTVASDSAVPALVAAIRAAGGDVGVSFGGYNGTELGQSCGSASALTAAYQSVISKYKLTHVDFDIENTALGDTANEFKRAQAIAMLEKSDPGLTVSLTIPMTSIGLPGTGTGEIQQAQRAGARLDVINIEDFDYGLTSGTQVSSDETVANDTVSELESLYGWSASTAWAHLGITLMNGHTDQPSELFTTAIFTSLRGFAASNHAASLTFWSFNRDRQCPAGVVEPWAPGNCSHISQKLHAFTTIVAQYAG